MLAGAALTWSLISARRGDDGGWSVPRLVHGTGPPPLVNSVGERAMELASQVVPAAWVERITDALGALSLHAEAQRQPLGLDLLAQDAIDAAQQLRPWLLPVLTAATSLVAGCWQHQSGWVRVATVAGSGLPAWGAGAAKLNPRSAFLAWPLTRAVALEATDATDATRVTDAIRQRLVSRTSHIALVIDRRISDGSLNQRERQLLRRTARRLRTSLRNEPIDPNLDGILAITRSKPGAHCIPWLTLAPNQLLIVPRLGVLARRREFVDELRGLARGLNQKVKLTNE